MSFDVEVFNNSHKSWDETTINDFHLFDVPGATRYLLTSAPQYVVEEEAVDFVTEDDPYDYVISRLETRGYPASWIKVDTIL